MILSGDRGELILLLRKPRSRWYALVCIGRKRHYRKDGSCKHTEDTLANMVRPECRHLVKIDPFGGRREMGANWERPNSAAPRKR